MPPKSPLDSSSSDSASPSSRDTRREELASRPPTTGANATSPLATCPGAGRSGAGRGRGPGAGRAGPHVREHAGRDREMPRRRCRRCEDRRVAGVLGSLRSLAKGSLDHLIAREPVEELDEGGMRGAVGGGDDDTEELDGLHDVQVARLLRRVANVTKGAQEFCRRCAQRGAFGEEVAHHQAHLHERKGGDRAVIAGCEGRKGAMGRR